MLTDSRQVGHCLDNRISFMKKSVTEKSTIKIAGIAVRTTNAKEWSSEGLIPGCIAQYYAQNIPAKIVNRINPGTMFCVYLDYESDHTGEYTFVAGEEVHSFDNMPPELKTFEIPAQKYVKHTTEPGPMPDVVKDAWSEIWQAGDEGLGAQRPFIADFEVYDHRAADMSNVVLDIYIGVK